MEHSAAHSFPDMQAIRNEFVSAGALDPVQLRFQVVEYDKTSGEMLGVPMRNIGFFEAIEKTKDLIEARSESHFLVHPVGFIQ
jgi:hypothetical protein